MAIRKIAQMGEPVLRRRAAEVPKSEIGSPRIQALVDDMIETMHDADGAGLAAPQVYESVRICVIEVGENPRYPDFPAIPLTVLVNPVVEPAVARADGEMADRDTIQMYEGCLSISGVRGRVRRPRAVRWHALDRRGQRIEGSWEGVPAAVIQHETDHLDGVLFIDRADPKTLSFIREYDRHVRLEDRVTDGAD